MTQATTPAENTPAETTAVETVPAVGDAGSGLRLAAFILNLISLVSSAVLVIPLAWTIPMTVISWGIYKGTKRNTVAFGVCTLLFLNLISGILLLIAPKDE